MEIVWLVCQIVPDVVARLQVPTVAVCPVAFCLLKRTRAAYVQKASLRQLLEINYALIVIPTVALMRLPQILDCANLDISPQTVA
jgi:hypothetical protein